MQKTIISVLFLTLIFNSCKNTTDENKNSESTSEEKIDTNKIDKDYIDKNQSSKNENSDTILKDDTFISVKDWKIENFIINAKDKKSPSVRSMIEYEKEQWKNVENPFVATYQGSDFGDYFHLIFKDTNGNEYDFGFGENNFGEYILYDQPDYNDNPKYVGKTFKVYWNWKITSFPCCDGEYEKVEAYLPSITKLELIDSKSHNK